MIPSNAAVQCPRCGERLEPGFLLDRLGGGSVQLSWVGGEPNAGADRRPDVRGQGTPVVAYRCTACGTSSCSLGRPNDR